MQFYYNFNSAFQPCDICKWHKSSVHSLLLIFSALCFLLRGYEQKLQKLNTKQKIQHSSPNSRAQIIREYQTSIWFTALSFNSNNFERFTDKIKDLDIALFMDVDLTVRASQASKGSSQLNETLKNSFVFGY